MTEVRVRLGIDFGTSNTVAVLAVGDRAPRALLFDGSPLLPSAVCLESPGRLLVGRDAWHLAIAEPASFEPYPKRCIDDGAVLLGGVEVPVVELFAAVIGRVVAEATAAAGQPPDETVLTHPAAWSARRQATLLAAAPAGVRLLPEPVAAASCFADLVGHRIPDGGTAVVYDFGAGTFDATVLRRAGDGFEVLSTCGLPDAGGLDIDAAIVAHLAETLGGHDRWHELDLPETATHRRARQQLWDGVRQAKEMLSRSTTTMIHVPLLEVEVPLGREVLDAVAAPVLDRTVASTREALDLAGVGPDQVVGIFLSGGSSRMPVVASALHRALGVRPVTVDQPELAVAEGSLRAVAEGSLRRDAEGSLRGVGEGSLPGVAAVGASAGTGADRSDGGWPGPPTALLPARAAGAVASWRARVRPGPVAAAAGVLVVVAAVVAAAMAAADGNHAGGAAPRGTASPSVSASPSPSYPPGIDGCLLGSWRVTTERNYGMIDGTRVQYTGGAGVVTTYRADGTSSTDYSAMEPRVATFKNATWSDVVRGSATFHYFAKDGVLQSTVVGSDAVGTLTRNGKYNNSAPVSYQLENQQYVCVGDTLRWTSTLGNFAGEAVRIPPPSPTPGTSSSG